jgi:ribosomal protein S18 acetylase RimI-like enzyme
VRNLAAPLFAHLGGYEQALDAWLRHPAVVTVVANQRGLGPIGFALVGRLDSGDIAEAYLLAIGVDPQQRRRGLGRDLLDAAIEEAGRRAERWGVSALRLDVASDNPAGRSLFAGAGFIAAGPGQDYARGQASLRMVRPLP